jgi:ABC-type multidrug transport system ATPase subunit
VGTTSKASTSRINVPNQPEIEERLVGSPLVSVGYNSVQMQPGTAAVQWTNLSKSFGRQVLFKRISGGLGEASTLVVTGPNGSGKSTLLRIIAGLASADSGQVERPDLASIGFCAPSLELYADLNGIENLQFFASILGIPSCRCVEVISEVGLSKSANKLYGSYSSGMKQRLKLAFAMLQQPSLLILDEPTIALDSDGISLVDRLIERHKAAGGSALIASNNIPEAERWGDSRLELAR